MTGLKGIPNRWCKKLEHPRSLGSTAGSLILEHCNPLGTPRHACVYFYSSGIEPGPHANYAGTVPLSHTPSHTVIYNDLILASGRSLKKQFRAGHLCVIRQTPAESLFFFHVMRNTGSRLRNASKDSGAFLK